MSPDRFFVSQFLFFVIWMAVLLWVPGLCPQEKIIVIKKVATAASARPTAPEPPAAPSPSGGAAVVPVAPGN